jgi:hypothetical protein
MKKVIVVLIACLFFASCKKDEVAPVTVATMNFYCKYPPYEISYWAIGGQQTRTITTQKATVQFAWDKDFVNNRHTIKSTSQIEGDSIWLDLEVDNKYHAMGLKLRGGFSQTIGFNYHALK